MTGRPTLTRNGGVLLAQCGDHAVLFASDADCQFFCAAYDGVPAILDENDGLKKLNKELGEDTLILREAAIQMLKNELEGTRAKLEQTEKALRELQCQQEGLRKARRAALYVAQKAKDMVLQIAELNRELQVARTEVRLAREGKLDEIR